jgi:putative endonuclease
MFSFKRKIGNQAEKIALKYLLKNGFLLIQQNYLTKLGEIDIIMLDKKEKTLVFVEVRYRKDNELIESIETVNKNKQNKIIRTANFYILKNKKYQSLAVRFDIIGIESNLKKPKIKWIKNAFS